MSARPMAFAPAEWIAARSTPGDAQAKRAGDGEDARVRHALLVVLKTLASLPVSSEARRLVAEAEDFLAQLDGWSLSPPPAEVRDRIMRGTLTIHLTALRLARESRG